MEAIPLVRKYLCDMHVILCRHRCFSGLHKMLLLEVELTENGSWSIITSETSLAHSRAR